MRLTPTASSTPRTATLRTRPSRLSISIYPPFAYNATGGLGAARVTQTAPVGAPEGALGLAFDSIDVPPLDWRTTRFLGLPLPPGLRIDIVLKRLEVRECCDVCVFAWERGRGGRFSHSTTPPTHQGWIHPPTGAVSLAFDADFFFTAFGVYKPPAIGVVTNLITGATTGKQLSGAGAPRDARTGAVRLAGVSTVARTGDGLLDAFLRAPSECLAVLDADLELT